jgi:hypothetical protein
MNQVIGSTLKMETIRICETSVNTYKTTRRYNLEDISYFSEKSVCRTTDTNVRELFLDDTFCKTSVT